MKVAIYQTGSVILFFYQLFSKVTWIKVPVRKSKRLCKYKTLCIRIRLPRLSVWEPCVGFRIEKVS